jgi:signal transduction histidine kinase
MPKWSAPLLVGWAAVFCALLAVAFLVHGAMRLSERRASFVSTVTHELRTPLTTLRLYSDMLESGAVKPEKRGEIHGGRRSSGGENPCPRQRRFR